jgi:hypothetical protein
MTTSTDCPASGISWMAKSNRPPLKSYPTLVETPLLLRALCPCRMLLLGIASR